MRSVSEVNSTQRGMRGVDLVARIQFSFNGNTAGDCFHERRRLRLAVKRLNQHSASGRGLMLMRAFADEMFFNSTGNEVTLVLYTDGCVRSPLDQ